MVARHIHHAFVLTSVQVCYSSIATSVLKGPPCYIVWYIDISIYPPCRSINYYHTGTDIPKKSEIARYKVCPPWRIAYSGATLLHELQKAFFSQDLRRVLQKLIYKLQTATYKQTQSETCTFLKATAWSIVSWTLWHWTAVDGFVLMSCQECSHDQIQTGI